MSEEQTPLQQEIKKETAFNALKNSLLGKDNADEALAMPFFIGTMTEQHNKCYHTGVAYIAYRDAKAAAEKNPKETRDVNALKVAYENLVADHFPGVPTEELIPMLINYMRFLYSGTDRLLLRDGNIEIARRDGYINTIPSKKKDEPFITPISPVETRDDKTLSVRDRMRRNLRRSQGAADSFNIILLNSLIFMRIKIPTPTDLIRLINDITTQLRNYGERFNVTAVHLERAGIAQVLVNFILDRLTYHSVKDVVDHYELKRYILANDINILAQGLLCVTAPKGVSYRMYCLADKCNYSELEVVDPTAMLLHIEEAMPADRREVLFQVVNEGRKLSREELKKYAPVYVDENGQPLDTTVDMGEAGKLNIGVPPLDTYFSCFNRMAERINPELRELAIQYPNLQEFKAKRAEYLSSIRGSEYIQWFISTETPPPANAEGEGEIIERFEDPQGFDDGLIDIFSDDEELFVEALQKVITLIPRLTYSYVGIMSDVCPSCKEKHEDSPAHLTGFTPIDPILNFFERTRTMNGIRAAQVSTIEDSLS